MSIIKNIARDATAPNLFNYTLTLNNVGSTDAFDVVLEDSLLQNPSPACTPHLVQVNVPAGATDNSTFGGSLSVAIGRLPAGGTASITYQVFLACSTESCPIWNEAIVTWTSLPGPQGTPAAPNLTGSSTPGASGAPNGERNGSENYPPAPLNSLDPPNNYYDKAQVNLCGEICVDKQDHHGNLLPGWEVEIDTVPPMTIVTEQQGPVCFRVFVGDYSLHEEIRPNWTPLPSATQTVTIDPDERETVTFRNRRDESKLVIEKRVLAGPNAPPSFDPNDPDFSFSLSCTDTGPLPTFQLGNGDSQTEIVLSRRRLHTDGVTAGQLGYAGQLPLARLLSGRAAVFLHASEHPDVLDQRSGRWSRVPGDE